jgi:hypothetical protein
MTIGQLVESLLGKACCEYGGFGDCTAFANKGPNEDVYGRMLVKAGFSASGNQILYNGMTGEQLFSDIYIGPTYYMRLKHMVKDKINYRALGPRTMLTRQTVQGRANDGGLRIGEMERDGVMAHGASAFLNESFMIRGDEYFMAVCNKTGAVAIYNPNLNLFLSPFSDGPVNFNTTLDGKMNIRSVSRFGRSFSIVRIPYALKLLIQELQVMNIQMRIITEDNVDQLLSMSYSDNINKLLQTNASLEEISKNYRTMVIDKKNKNVTKQAYIPFEQPEYPEIGIEEKNEKPPSPQFEFNMPAANEELTPEPSSDSSLPYAAPVTPPYAPGTPPYAPGTPPYAPGTPVSSNSSVPFAPGTPVSSNSSVPFAPGTPLSTNSSLPFAPGSPVTSINSSNTPPINQAITQAQTTVPLNINIEDAELLKKVIEDKKKEEEKFEPIVFEKPKVEKSILEIEDEKPESSKEESESSSSSSSSSSNDNSSEKKIIKLG